MRRREFLLAGVAALSAPAIGSAWAAPAAQPVAPTLAQIVAATLPGYVVSPPCETREQRRALALARQVQKVFAPTGSILTERPYDAVVTLLETALFDHPNSAVRPSSVPLLTQTAASLLAHADCWLEVAGHYHDSGRAALDLVESQRRGVAIQAVLYSRKVPDQMVIVSGLGASWPIGPNTTPQGRSLNRRVDLVFRPRLSAAQP